MGPVLESGILEVKSGPGGGRYQTFTINVLDENDLPDMLALQDEIVRNMHCRTLVEPFSSDFMNEHLGACGFALGAFSAGRLVGFRNVYFPGSDDPEWNLGRDIGLPDSELPKVANLQLVCVLPDYRGNSLALKMNRLSLGLLRQLGTYDHICASVSPLNIWNLRILLNCGFHVKKLKVKYGGNLRYVVYQRIKVPVSFHIVTVATVSLKDYAAQKRLLRDGHCAVGLRPMGHAGRSRLPLTAYRWELLFRQPVLEPAVHVVPRRSGKTIGIDQPTLVNGIGERADPDAKGGALPRHGDARKRR